MLDIHNTLPTTSVDKLINVKLFVDNQLQNYYYLMYETISCGLLCAFLYNYRRYCTQSIAVVDVNVRLG